MLIKSTLDKLLKILTPTGRRTLVGLALLMTLNGLVQLIGVASWAPFVFALEPETVAKHPLLNQAYVYSGLENHSSFLALLGVGVLAFYLISSLFALLTVWSVQRFSWLEGHRLAQELLECYLNKPYPWFLEQNASELTKNLIEEVTNTVRFIILRFLLFFAEGLIAALLALGLFWLDPAVALCSTILVVAIYSVIATANRLRLSKIGKDRLEATEARYKMGFEALSAVKESKALADRRGFTLRFEEPSLKFHQLKIAEKLHSEAPRHLAETTAVAVMLGVAIYFLTTQGGPKGALTYIVLYLASTVRLIPSVQSLYKNLVYLRVYQPSLDKIYKELENSSNTRPATAQLDVQNSLTLKQVSFTYPSADEPAIRQLSLSISKGSVVALVGKTGAGKTTVGEILAGLLKPQVGTFEIDEKPLGADAIGAWQRNIGYVPQEIYILDDTIERNIAFGVPDAEVDSERVREVASLALLKDFIESRLDHGYQTILGERGSALSGGQRQRIGIARALYHKPSVLLLDEATGSLDNLTAHALWEAVENLGPHMTVILIAHRMKSVRNCKRIYLIDDGALVADGTYQELLETSTLFQRLVEQEQNEQSPIAPIVESQLS